MDVPQAAPVQRSIPLDEGAEAAVRAFDPEAVIDAMAPLLGLAVEPGSRESVVFYLRVSAGFAALVLGLPLEDTEVPAPVFRA